MKLNSYHAQFRMTAYAAFLAQLGHQCHGTTPVIASVAQEVDSIDRSMLPICDTDQKNNVDQNGTFREDDDSFCRLNNKMDNEMPSNKRDLDREMLELDRQENRLITEMKLEGQKIPANDSLLKEITAQLMELRQRRDKLFRAKSKLVAQEGEEELEDEDELEELYAERSEQDIERVIQEECGVYLAPSTIPGAGLGMFAGKSYDVHEHVTQGDIIIPLSSLDWHNGFRLAFFLWEEYTWDGDMFPGLNDEIEMETIQYCSTGIGAAVNCMLPLVNLADERIKVDNAGLNHIADPGAGAFTSLHDRKSYALYDIEAGAELFMDYGEHYFASRTATYGLMPLSKSYENADGLIERFDKLIGRLSVRASQRKTHKGRRGLRKGFSQDLYQLIKNLPYTTRTLNALPDFVGLNDALVDGSQWQDYNRSKVSLEWLSKNGQCMDNIYPGRSTVKQAGRGVFASRVIKKGGLVAPAPLIHIKNKKELLMYDELPEDRYGSIARNVSSPNHNQLLLNYCFGHPQSTLLLSPYGMFTSLVNHASLSSGKVNAKITWSKTMRKPEWMEQKINKWVGHSYSGLSFDFVATRDIQPDEEIFIDYGEDWDNAWNAHVTNWESSLSDNNSSKHLSVFQLEENLDLHIPTKNNDNAFCFEHNINSYIREEYRLMAGYRPRESQNNYHRCRPISKIIDSDKNNNNVPLYLVELVRRKNDAHRGLCWVVTDEVLFNVPRDAFVFVDRASITDQLSTHSFRHDMMIPDEMFPKAWRNIISDSHET